MKRKNVTRPALFTSILAMLLCVSMLVGTTFAWFTDEVVTGLNTITAGNLDVVLEYKTSADGQWQVVEPDTKIFSDSALYEPGYTEVVFLRVSNAGSLALKYNLMVNTANEQSAVNVYGDEFKLSEYLQIGTYRQDEYDASGFNYADILLPVMFGSRETALNNVTLNKLSEGAGLVAENAPLMAGEKTAQVFAIVLTMPKTVENEANHNGTAPTVDLGVSLVATQLTAEEDSFGSDYDEDATYPAIVFNAAEMKDALTSADVREIVLANDVTLAEAVKVTTDKVIVLNGYDFTADSGSRPFQVYGADITIHATGSNVELDKYGLVDIREGDDVQISITGGTFTGELDNGSVIKGRANTKAEIYLKDVNMTFTDSSVKGSYVYNPEKTASATTTIDGGVYNIDCGFIGNVTMKDATVNAKGFIFNGGGSIENSTLTTDGSSKAPADAAPFCCVAASNNRTITVKNSTLTATNCNAIEVYPTGGIVTVTGSTVTGTCYKHPLYDASYNCSITINGVEQ